MKILDDGHKYELGEEPFNDVEVGKEQIISFIKREGKEGNLVNAGTTNEEVLEVLIDRMKYLQNKVACRENAIVITKLEEALMWLEKRTKKRINQGVETKDIAHKD